MVGRLCQVHTEQGRMVSGPVIQNHVCQNIVRKEDKLPWWVQGKQ